jgi:hypothetical protein
MERSLRPTGRCFAPAHHLLVVTDFIDRRVTVVVVDSELIRDVVSGCVPTQRHGVACCALDDLVVGDSVNSGIVVLSVDGDLLVSCRYGPLSGVAMHYGIVFAMDGRGQRTVRGGRCRRVVFSKPMTEVFAGWRYVSA